MHINVHTNKLFHLMNIQPEISEWKILPEMFEYTCNFIFAFTASKEKDNNLKIPFLLYFFQKNPIFKVLVFF